MPRIKKKKKKEDRGWIDTLDVAGTEARARLYCLTSSCVSFFLRIKTRADA